MRPSALFTLIDFCGVLAGALGGALIARRDETYEYDFIGILGLGLISGVGGGVARDVLLQRGPPLALVDVRYLWIALTGAALGLVISSGAGKRLQRTILAVDAAALGLFAVAGATRASHAGLTFLPALLLGAVTAVGGGSLRDVFSGRAPRVFERGEPYALVAALAATLYLAAIRLRVPPGVATALAAGLGFTLRLLALRFHWRTRPARKLE